MRSRSACTPSIANSRNESHASARRSTECRKLKIITGLNTLSSKLPCEPAIPMVASLPITCTQTIVMASLWVGFTLPGMIDEPGSFSGRISSPRPARGPDASQRMSLAIFISDTASVLSAPLANTSASWAASAANLFGADTNGRPVSSAISAAAPVGELGVGVEPGADRGAADGELVEPGQHLLDALEVGVELRHVAAELLAERERHRVLQVRAADLHDVGELVRLRRRARRAAARTDGHQLACTTSSAAAMCIAVGNVSFDDCDMFTSSLGWTGFLLPRSPPASSMARFEITSLTFMFVCVPLPVCQT